MNWAQSPSSIESGIGNHCITFWRWSVKAIVLLDARWTLVEQFVHFVAAVCSLAIFILPEAINGEDYCSDQNYAANRGTNYDAQRTALILHWSDNVVVVLRSRYALVYQVGLVVHVCIGNSCALVRVYFIRIVLLVLLVENNVPQVSSRTDLPNTNVQIVNCSRISFVRSQTERCVILFQEWGTKVVNIITGRIIWQFPDSDKALAIHSNSSSIKQQIFLGNLEFKSIWAVIQGKWNVLQSVFRNLLTRGVEETGNIRSAAIGDAI